MRDDADEIRRRLTDSLEQLLSTYFPSHVVRRGKAYLSPKGAKQLGSFIVNLTGARRGQFYRFSQQIGGGVVELLSYHLTGGTKAYEQAFREARIFLGISDDRSERDTQEYKERRAREAEDARRQRERQEKEEAQRRQKRAATATELWAECRPIKGTLAEKYLTGRGLPVPPDGWPSCLGFHKGLEWELGAEFDGDRKVKSGPVFPCLIGEVVDVEGDTIAIWRIYLDPKTGGKAPVDNPKVGFGPAKGGAIRIGGDAALIGVAEGIESALGAWSLIGFRRPVWGALSTSGMSNLEIPSFVQRISVFPDGDRPFRRQGDEYVTAEPAGRKAARALKERCDAAGIACVIQAEPPAGFDYLDLYNEQRSMETA